ncbi:MAG: YkgJ family cysteine cluster protein [Polyangiaceae bacterium]
MPPPARARTKDWKASAARSELIALYAEADALLAPFSCDASTDCCHFGVTGREPYVTPTELAEIEHAVAARGAAPPRLPRAARSLPLVDDPRRCALLDANGRCSIYASRPLGCRTFFCERVQGPGRIPRTALNDVARRVSDLAARVSPRDPHSRPLSRALPALLRVR